MDDEQRSRAIAAQPAAKNGRLTSEQVQSWRSRGFTFVSGVLPESLVDELALSAGEAFPAAGDPQAAALTDFGSGGAFTFPSRNRAFNDVTLHPNLLRAVSDLLGETIEDIRLSQSDLWPKYGRDQHIGIQDNSDQRIHVDYPNHTLVHPTPWYRPEAVEMILYLDNVDETGGSTAVVPREGDDDPAWRWPIVDSPGIGELRYINDRQAAEAYFASERPALAEWRRQLYARERYTDFRRGDIIFYRHDTWHRGTPLLPGSRRLAHNLTFRKASSEWISTLHTGWSWSAYSIEKFLERLLAGASLEQRAVLGFPQPGNEYWCEETIAAADARYGMFGFDSTPYRAALREGK